MQKPGIAVKTEPLSSHFGADEPDTIPVAVAIVQRGQVGAGDAQRKTSKTHDRQRQNHIN